jgi:hypothetical protein
MCICKYLSYKAPIWNCPSIHHSCSCENRASLCQSKHHICSCASNGYSNCKAFYHITYTDLETETETENENNTPTNNSNIGGTLVIIPPHNNYKSIITYNNTNTKDYTEITIDFTFISSQEDYNTFDNPIFNNPNLSIV